MMSRRERIADVLETTFHPADMEVTDESERHHGHSGWREGGETHFRVRLVAEAFVGRSRLDRHRLVQEALKDEFASGLHALAIEARAPCEPGRG
jgi:BolA family transcriptional regulator, general stress-responsive regulator